MRSDPTPTHSDTEEGLQATADALQALIDADLANEVEHLKPEGNA